MPVMTSTNVGFLNDAAQLRNLIKGANRQGFHPVDQLSDQELVELLSQLSQIKRFHEKCKADPQFKELFLEDAQAAINSLNLKIDSEEIERLKDDAIAQRPPTASTVSALRRFQEIVSESPVSPLEQAGFSQNENFKAWRERQLARCSSQMSKSTHQEILHMTAAFELNKGCSVGCWFCSVSAPKLSDIFFYTPENASLWQEVLQLLKNIHGKAAGASFCYWATDPLDNPDYEKFCLDFQEILGVFPQTTTAQAWKQPQRVKELLKLSIDKGCRLNRFSVISLKVLEQIYQQFTPEELGFVNLVLQNPEAKTIKVNAGRSRQRNLKKAEKDNQPVEQSTPQTNACATGFLFNMVDRTVKLISPYPASDVYPDGYRIFEEGTFNNAEELKTLLEGIIERQMPLSVKLDQPLSFRSDLIYEELPDGFQLSTPYKIYKYRQEPFLKALGSSIARGDKTPEEIISVFSAFGVPPQQVLNYLQLMFNQAVLSDGK